MKIALYSELFWNYNLHMLEVLYYKCILQHRTASEDYACVFFFWN